MTASKRSTTLKLLIDGCVPPAVTERLLAEGWDVADVRERGADPGDVAILKWAVDEQRALVTIDTDFGVLVFRDGAHHFGVLRLRQLRATELADRATFLIAAHEADLDAGSFVTDDGDAVRVSKRSS